MKKPSQVWSLIGLLLLFGVVSSAQRQSPFPPLENFARWSSAEIKALGAKLGTNVLTGPATERLGDSGSLRVFLERRAAGEYEPEVHTEIDDLLIVQQGEATLLYGGTIEGGKEVRAGQIGGGKIVGGTSLTISAGDVIFLPAGMPHHISVAPGNSLYVLVVKTTSSKAKGK
jgi:uncharacterized RmlC-like cupin family protein